MNNLERELKEAEEKRKEKRLGAIGKMIRTILGSLLAAWIASNVIQDYRIGRLFIASLGTVIVIVLVANLINAMAKEWR